MTFRQLLNFIDEDCEIELEDVSGINNVVITKDNPFIELFGDLTVTNIYAVRVCVRLKGLTGGDVRE